ncbi:MAG: hypothetical protein ACQER5_10600, partial [Pseudomonadota bacterium]
EVRSVMVSSLLSDDTSLTDAIQRQKMGFVDRLRMKRSGGLPRDDSAFGQAQRPDAAMSATY